MRQSSEKPLVVRLCTNPGIKVLASLLILGALVNPTVANDNNDEDWVRDSLSGDHQDQQFVAGGRVEVTTPMSLMIFFAAGN